MKNIGILGGHPASTLAEIINCKFAEICPHVDLEANIICRRQTQIKPRDFLEFLLQNHIGALFVSNDVVLNCAEERYEVDEFKHAVEQIFEVIWESPKSSK